MKISKFVKVFVLGVIMYLITVLPFIIYHGGVFFYYGDYNVQQVPFYILAHRAVREGNFFWNSHIDLGSNMGGSFAFYLWGSPFFWLTIPFKESFLPYIMPFIMSLKYGTAMTTSFAYIRKFTKTDRAALLGAILYAFSGFQACNIVFQHFHEVTAFFPLYLLALDAFVEKKKHVPFVLMTAFMSILNYYFFVGEVVFLIIYYIVRFATRQNIRKTVKEVLSLLIFGLLGLLIAAFFLVQSITGLFGNSRLDNWISGYDLVCYPNSTTPFAILKSMFIVPDLIAKGTLFSNDDIRNSSMSLYLPCLGIGGVVAYFSSHKKGWMKRLLVVLGVCAFVPVFNAVFSALNSEYYARWYYLPILFMALLTAKALEEGDEGALKNGAFAVLAGTFLVVVCACLPVMEAGEMEWFTISDNMKLLVAQIIGTVATLPVMLYLLVIYKPKETPSRATTRAIILVAICAIFTTMTVLFNGNRLIARSGGVKWQQQMLDEVPELYDNTRFSRVETDSTSTNYEMVWGFPTIHCFQSTVNPSIFDFYTGIGMNRTVESTLPMERVGARALLSMRYYLENDLVKADESYTSQGGLPGYVYVNYSNGYNIYENTHAIPMGFSFTSYMTEDNYNQVIKGTVSDKLLVKNIMLNAEQSEKYGAYMTEDTNTDPEEMTLDEFYQECDARAASACTDMAFDSNGFHATANMTSDNLLFFSVPYDEGFTATVDGVSAEVECVDYGLMAVFVPQGQHEVVFTYRPYGFTLAIWGSLFGVAILLLSIGFTAYRRRKIASSCQN